MSRYNMISQKGAVWYINRGLESVKLYATAKALTTYYKYYNTIK